MDLSRWQSIPAFSPGRFGSQAAHFVFWAGCLLVLFASGMGFVKLYAKTLSGLIGSKATWFLRFGASGSIRRFLKTSTTNAEGQIKRDRLNEYAEHDRKRSSGTGRVFTALGMLLAFSWAGGTMLAAHDHRKIATLEAQVKEYKLERTRPSVIDRSPSEVLERIDKKSFRARYNNPNTGELIEFVVKGCPGHPDPTDEIQAGVTLQVLEWVEDSANRCMILDGWGGYTLWRSGTKPVLTAFKEN
jgi:hypothetical protein